MLDRHIVKEGLLVFENGKILVDGWEANDGCMCREIGILACLYVAQKLMEDAAADIKEAGLGKTAIGAPDYHPSSYHNPLGNYARGEVDKFDKAVREWQRLQDPELYEDEDDDED